MSLCDTASTAVSMTQTVDLTNQGASCRIPSNVGLKGGGKWASLEHSGVTFFPKYEPHGVPINHNKK